MPLLTGMDFAMAVLAHAHKVVVVQQQVVVDFPSPEGALDMVHILSGGHLALFEAVLTYRVLL